MLGEVSAEQCSQILDNGDPNQNLAQKLYNKVDEIFEGDKKYGMLKNNCQHFATKVIKVFGLDEKIIFTMDTDYSFDKYCSYYRKKPKFETDQHGVPEWNG